MPDSGSPLFKPGGDDSRRLKVPWDEIDQLMVVGERITDPQTGQLITRYPGQREIADRYGVSKSRVAAYSKQNRVMVRRKEAQLARRERQNAEVQRHRERRDVKVTRLSVEEEIEIIDAYLIKFAENLQNGTVDANNPADFNLMVRLKRFVQGEADARAEVRTILSLDALRERHERQQARVSQATDVTTGMEAGEDSQPPAVPRGPFALPPAPYEGRGDVIDVDPEDVEEALDEAAGAEAD